jgi:ribosomal protein S27E
MKTGKTHGYVLTFRCINCGRHEVFADYATEEVEPEDRIRGRIYEVTCYSCGWSGDACGQSAIRISRTDLGPRGARWQSSGS